MNRREAKAQDEFFESKGLPYRIVGMPAMFNMIKTRGSKSIVIAQVGTVFYAGYYGYAQGTNVAADIRRVRKYKVTDCCTFKGEE